MTASPRGEEELSVAAHEDVDVISRYFYLESHISQHLSAVVERQMRDTAHMRYILRNLVTFSALFVFIANLILLFSPVSEMTKRLLDLLSIPNAGGDPFFSLMLSVLLYGIFVLAALPGSYLALTSLGRRRHYSAWTLSIFLLLPSYILVLNILLAGWEPFDWLRVVVWSFALNIVAMFLGLIFALVLWVAANTVQGVMGSSFYLLRLSRAAPPRRSSGRSPDACRALLGGDKDVGQTAGASRHIINARMSITRLRQSMLEALSYGPPSEAELVHTVLDRVNDDILEWPEALWRVIDRTASNRLSYLGARSDLTSYILALLGILAFMQIFFGSFSLDFSLLLNTESTFRWLSLLPLLVPLVVFIYLISLIRTVFLYFSRSQESVWVIEIIQHLAHRQISRQVGLQSALLNTTHMDDQGSIDDEGEMKSPRDLKTKSVGGPDSSSGFVQFLPDWAVALILVIVSVICQQSTRRR